MLGLTPEQTKTTHKGTFKTPTDINLGTKFSNMLHINIPLSLFCILYKFLYMKGKVYFIE